jgi:hypothetical protein
VRSSRLQRLPRVCPRCFGMCAAPSQLEIEPRLDLSRPLEPALTLQPSVESAFRGVTPEMTRMIKRPPLWDWMLTGTAEENFFQTSALRAARDHARRHAKPDALLLNAAQSRRAMPAWIARGSWRLRRPRRRTLPLA